MQSRLHVRSTSIDLKNVNPTKTSQEPFFHGVNFYKKLCFVMFMLRVKWINTRAANNTRRESGHFLITQIRAETFVIHNTIIQKPSQTKCHYLQRSDV